MKTDCAACASLDFEPRAYCNACFDLISRKLQDLNARFIVRTDLLKKIANATLPGDITFYQRLAREELGL